MKPETSYYMTDIMQGVLEKGGTGTQARIDRPVAGKTGTTQHGIRAIIQATTVMLGSRAIRLNGQPSSGWVMTIPIRNIY